MYYLFYTLRIVLLAVVAVSSLESREITLQMLFDSASKNSLSLKGKQNDIGIESARLESTKSDYYPVLSLSYNNEYNRDLGDGLGGVESVGDTVITNGTRYQSSLSLNLNYELYHFGATERKVAIATKEVLLKRLEWCEEEKNLHQKILEEYTKALKADVSIKKQQQIVELRRKIYNQKERLYKAGKYSKFELGNEAISIIDLERSIEQSKIQYDDALIMLTELSHVELVSGKDKFLPLTAGVNNLMQEVSFENTAEGMRISEQIRQKHDEVVLHDRSRLPSIVFYSNYYLYGSDPDSYEPSVEALRRSSWKAGVGLRWTIFEGFRFDSDMKRLKLEMQKLRDEHDERQRMYTYEQQMKHSRIEHFKSLQQHNKMAVVQSEKNVKMSDRLRKYSQIKGIDALVVKLENLEHHLTLATNQIDHEHEQMLLNIMNKGVDQCTQH